MARFAGGRRRTIQLHLFRDGPRIQLRLAGDAERPVLIVDAGREGAA